MQQTLSDHLRAVLGYLDGLRMLLEAKDRGELVDADAPEREISRAESSTRHVLRLVTGDDPA